MRAEGWVADDTLGATELAARLGVSKRTLSRTLSVGAGLTVPAFLSGLRVEAVCERLDAGDDRDLLTLALEAGFASKTGFNRAFSAHAGCTPTAYRRARREGSLPA